MINHRKTLVGAVVAVLAVLVGSASGQDQDRLLRAQATMLRRTLERRDEEVRRLRERVAELQQRIAELEADLERFGSGEPPADTDAADEVDDEPESPVDEVVAETQPGEADYYGLARLLRAVPASQMPGDAPTPRTRREFSEWAQETFGGKVLYAMFDVADVRQDKDGTWVLRGHPPRAADRDGRKFFVTVVARISDEQYSGNRLEPGDRAKLLGRMSADTPVEPIKANISDTHEERLYGRVVARRTIEAEIDGWSSDYAVVLVTMEAVRMLD